MYGPFASDTFDHTFFREYSNSSSWNGVLLDAKNQFAVVALKEGHRPKRESIMQAAESAGYEAMDYYMMEGDVVRKVKL